MKVFSLEENKKKISTFTKVRNWLSGWKAATFSLAARRKLNSVGKCFNAYLIILCNRLNFQLLSFVKLRSAIENVWGNKQYKKSTQSCLGQDTVCQPKVDVIPCLDCYYPYIFTTWEVFFTHP